MSVIEAKRNMAALATKASETVGNKDMTNAEKKTALDQIEVDLKGYSDEISLHEQASRMVEGAESTPEAKEASAAQDFRSFGQRITDSDGYKSMIKGQSKGVNVEVKATANTIGEGVIPAFSGGAGQGGQLTTPQFLPGIVPLLFQPLTIADLIASGSTENSSLTYVIEAAFNDNTATVAEKGAKPQLDLTLTRRQDNVSKIANTAKVTDEMFQDASAFQAYLSNRMVFGVQRQEEAQLLSGNGTSPNLQGILNRAGLAPTVVTSVGQTAVKIMEGIFNQITQLRAVSFVEPDAIVMHPNDWQTIRLGKDVNGQYYAGGPFTGAYGNPGPSNVESIWGLKTVITTAIAQGSALVGNFQQSAQIFRRQGITLEMTNSNVDDFVNNLITLRAEERLALAVYRPAGFGIVTLTA